MAFESTQLADRAIDTPALPGHRPAAATDQFTIRRLMLLIAGISLGIAVFAPKPEDFKPLESDSWRILATGILIGATLSGGVFAISRRRGGERLGAGALLSLTLALGIVLMFPPSVMARFYGGPGTALTCLYYVLPLMSLWFLVAAAVGGQIRRGSFSTEPFSERYGIYLSVLWSPLAIWILWDFYREAFF